MNQQTIKENEEVIGEAAEPRTIKETPLQGTKAASKQQLRATGKKKDLKSDLEYDDSDPMAVEAASFRHHWKFVWTGRFGSYEDITRIPPMIYMDKKREPGHSPLEPMETLQVFSVKIMETAQSLPWPLDVFGMVVARDVLDHNRNIIFHRTRDNCQTITAENPYLELTGPSRAIVVLDPVHFEVMLQVKGSVQSEDKVISFLVVKYDGYGKESRVLKRLRPSKLSTVELTFGSIVRSVEATISVQVVAGSWPDGFRGEFTAITTSLDDMKIQLLDFGDGMFPVSADGIVKLSRRVVSVELKGELIVSVKAVGDQAVEWRDSKVFGAQKSSRRKADVEVGSCKMKVTVAWSLLSDRQYFGSGLSA
ncbi:hypothetical protein QYE76_050190 [Lolium multiflorum]|uniref:DUF6598 domain-containing protein n=1 Tax=Lolium multiflorum TaxID=4521 RepID=A0AAD8SR86_LOLMU|nr:hypothetical protein QYE76_050190 [Lolium multiflorum]